MENNQTKPASSGTASHGTASTDSFSTLSELQVAGKTYGIHSLPRLGPLQSLPYVIRILLENLLRHEDGETVTKQDIEALANWNPEKLSHREVAFYPSRVLMQDFTGVPAVVDLAAMRDALADLGGDPGRVNPLVPVDLVIDHSVIAQSARKADSFAFNARLEFEQNRERYQLLKWAQQAFDRFRVIPPDTGICHQVNLEYLAKVVFTGDDNLAYPDTLVGTDSHTTMINGLGVLGWGVGGIEAEAVMLGQPVPMLIPPVVGLYLEGELPPGTTATDLVLTVASLLRSHGVVGKLVELFGPGVSRLPLETRATIGNMSPEYGATCTYSPIDAETLRYLRLTGRSEEQLALVEAYAKHQGLWHDPDRHPLYSEEISLDLSTVEPSLAGPSRPQDRIPLSKAASKLRETLQADSSSKPIVRETRETGSPLKDGDVVIAAITSCTNTSNPEVMVAAGLLAKKALERGLTAKEWVKTSLAPGSKVVTEYLAAAGLLESLAKIGFELVGYGCTTCIGNSGPLLEGVGAQVEERKLSVAAVLSGNRNFEGRIHPQVRLNYLASPPLVVAYALAGTMARDLTKEPLGTDAEGKEVFLSDLWPSPTEVMETIHSFIHENLFDQVYSTLLEGDENWRALKAPTGQRFEWDPASTYVRKPPFFDGITPEPSPLRPISDARVLLVLGDSVTTDHISPAGSIPPSGPAGRYLTAHGVRQEDFNSLGSRRGNHEVMIRGTFANIRIRNQLAPGTEGGYTRILPGGEVTTVYEASVAYQEKGVPLLVLAGAEYGSGSSRDWAAKGTALLGIRAVVAKSFERIHRSNLIGMGVLPLQFPDGQGIQELGLTGEELFTIDGMEPLAQGRLVDTVTLKAKGQDPGLEPRIIPVRLRIDTPKELAYYLHGGILPYVLRSLL
jgi:aconitate hydratase